MTISRLTWHPIVLTFTYSEKEVRRNPDILGSIRQQTEQLDIKAINAYVIDSTTHVVAAKRNLPKVLQALVNGKHIVTEDFIAAIAEAASSPGAVDGGGHIPSPLEEDFNGAWPAAINYLPPASKEPHPRPASDFAPDARRMAVFENYTFIFCYDSQFENISPILTSGGAKTLYYPLVEGQTSIDDFHQYIRNVAEKKGLQEVYDPDKSKAVVVVRPPGGDEKTSTWTKDFYREVDIRLEQRSVWQNEFLDPILKVDPSPLKRPLDEETQGARPPASTAPEPSSRGGARDGQVEHDQTARSAMEPLRNRPEPETSTPETSQTSQVKPVGRIKRTVTKSKFKGLDDSDEDDVPAPKKSALVPVQEENEVASNDKDRRGSVISVDSQSLFVSNSRPQSQMRQPNSPVKVNGNSKKRPRASLEVEDQDDASMMDSLLPGAAAMKKRRIEEEQRATSHTPVPSRQATPQPVNKLTTAKEAKAKLADLHKTTREHAARLDAQRRSATRTYSQDIDEREPLDLAGLASLAIVEEMDIVPRRNREFTQTNSMNGTSQTDNPRWDDRWNGLKNFKKFRRRGESAVDPGNRAPKVMVQLEEVKRKDFGIGESYWLQDSASSRSGRKNKSQSQTQTQSQSQLRVRTRAEEEEDMELDIDPEEIAGAPRDDRIRNAVAGHQGSTAGSQRTSPATAKKRPSTSGTAAKAPPAKRQKQTKMPVMRNEVEESSEDEAKFKFSRKR